MASVDFLPDVAAEKPEDKGMGCLLIFIVLVFAPWTWPLVVLGLVFGSFCNCQGREGGR